MSRIASRTAIALAAAFAWSAHAAVQTPASMPAAAPPAAASYVGAQTCISCHAQQGATWKDGRHSKMVQPATQASVKGDFTQREIVLNGSRYKLRAAGGRFFVTESYLNGTEQEHQIEFTLGNRRIQHYLTTIDNGRIIVLPPSWDVQRRQWFDNMEIVRPDEHDAKPVQQWNKNCVGCHVSQQDNHYDPAAHTYSTQWTDFGTSCERCHGPGSAHVDASRARANGSAPASPMIVRPTRLDATAGSTVCAQCHSMRDVIAPGFTPGSNYYDYFQPVLEYGPRKEKDPAYWADGRPRRFSNDAIGLWQSQCFLRGGATCTSCHRDPHLPDVDKNPQLGPANNVLCTQCHQAIGNQLPAHTRHKAQSAGSSCVECHMPRTVVSIKSTMRDHTIGLPAPENTVKFGIPNACTECHADKPATWAVEQITAGWPQNRRRAFVERAETFTAARSRKSEALDRLIAILNDTRQAPLIRANATGYLAGYIDSRALDALSYAAVSTEPPIRAVAMSALGRLAHDAPATRTTLLAALVDPTRAVRIAALAGIINAGGGPLGPSDAARFRWVTNELAARANLHQDDAAVQHDLGLAKLLVGEFDAAAAALQISVDLDPDGPASRFFRALARLGLRRAVDARTLLKSVPKSDPYYAAAQDRLKQLDAPR